MNGKGQVSVEFIIVLVLLLSLFLFSLAAFAEKNSGYINSMKNHEARLVADQLASAINKVFLAGNGAETAVLLEKRFDFNASVSGNAVVVEWENNYVDSAILTDSVTVGSLSLGNWVNVRNVNGGIEIENA